MPGTLVLERRHDASRSSAIFGKLGALGPILARTLMFPVRYYRARRELAVLGSMSEYELRDIGLTRADLNNVTALPADEDPTLHLARVVDERRHHSAGRRGR